MARKTPATTSTYMYYNLNPKNLHTSDCAIRALAAAMEQSWYATLAGLYEQAVPMAMEPTERKVIAAYLKRNGWTKHNQPRRADGTKYTGADFTDRLAKQGYYGTVVASIGAHHLTCIGGGRILDTWDCGERCIGNYWTKEVK